MQPTSLGGLRAICFLAACMPLLTTGSCGRDEHAEHGGSHAAEDREIQSTVWEFGYEVLFVHHVPWTNTQAKLVFHITRIESGLPKRSGAVRWEGRSPSGKSVDKEMTAPVAAGTYMFDVVLAEKGRWEHQLTISGAAENSGEEKAVTIALPCMRVYQPGDSPDESSTSEADEGIALLKEQQWPFRLRSVPAEKIALAPHVRLPGVVNARTGGKALVVPPVAGRFFPPSSGRLPHLGEEVAKGQVLGRIEPPLAGSDMLTITFHHHELQVLEAELAVKFVQSQAEVRRSQVALDLAKAALGRVERLAKIQAKSAKELELAQYNLATATAADKAAGAVTVLYKNALDELHAHPVHDKTLLERFPAVEIRSPIRGRIDQIGVAIGETVDLQREIFTVLDTSVVYVVASLSEYEIQRLQEPRDSYLEITDVEGETLRRSLKFLYSGEQLGESRRIPLVFQTRNEDGLLRLGMAVDVLVQSEDPRSVVTVPVSALVEEGGTYSVFVQRGGELFQRRTVEIGARARDLVEIREGLSEGERVVSRGAYLVRLASFSTRRPVHSHME